MTMGRLQEFDEAVVIEQAQQLFWRKGYNATSMADLLEATGLHKGSLYRAFESKEKLFLLALNHYAAGAREAFIQDQDPVEYLRNFYRTMIRECVKDSKGCFIMNSCVELGVSGDLAGKVARSIFAEVQKNLGAALARAREEGALPADSDLKALTARFTGAAFSIREMSKFQKDGTAFKAVANGVLEEIGARI